MPSLGHWKIPQIRTGRRSISVGKLLEKERLGTLFKKHGGSRLREALNLVSEPGVLGGTHYQAMLGDAPVGWMKVEKGKAVESYLDSEFRGMGLGKKMYGEVMRRQPGQTLASDTKVSPAAQRIWESMKKDPSYTVKEPIGGGLERALINPHMPLVDRILKRFPKAQEIRPMLDRPLLRSPYSATLPAASAVKVGHKLDGETTFQGLDIAVENDVGSTRSGRDADGSRWSIKYRTPYGYIRGTTGADDEEVDCYVGRDKDADKAYVVHQKADDGSYDEDTIMLGYGSQAAAKSDILRHYSDPKYVGKIVPIAMERLKELLESKKKLEKISFATKDPEYIDAEAENTVGLPAPLRKRRGDVPSRDEVELNPTPKVEARGNNMETHLVGEFHSPGGNDDLGKFGAALSALGAMSEDWEGDADVGLSLATAREKELRGPDPFHTLSEIAPVDDSLKMAMVRQSFIAELTKIGQVHGVPPWAGELADFERYVEAFQKEAGPIGQAVRGAVGRLRPAAVAPEVAAMRKGVGFFSTGMGKDLSAGGKMLAHNPQTAGRAAGLGAKDLGSLNAMRPSTAGRRIAGETAMGAGHHMGHAGPALMAMNPVGVPMGGAIEGFTRGVGKEMQGAAHKGVQSAGRALVKHAPKVGFGGELLAGNALHTPGLAAMAGHRLAPMASSLFQHGVGAGVQEASLAAPRMIPRAGQMLGQAAMGLKARAGHWGGKLVGA